jgi:imidazolonepropionase
MLCDRLWRNARLATLAPGKPGLGVVEDGIIACRDGLISHVGPAADAPAALDAREIVDCHGRWITPGLIDCHTHLVYAGDRSAEFEQRLNGVTYEEIARHGGGIASTVRATRAASRAQLVTCARERLNALVAEGVTTVEIKSGYGLDLETERRLLEVAGDLADLCNVTVSRTFLGAHAVPPEFRGRADEYIAGICDVMIPTLAQEGLIDAVDAFCERIGFSREQTQRVFEAARSRGLPVKLHAEQLSNMGGAALAASFGAMSADHLEYADAAAVEAMASAGTTAVLLPGAFYFLRETQLPPLDLLRARRVPMALATDHNPGTSPISSLLLVLNLAATLFRMTVDECVIGVTRAAAQALGLAARTGTLETGKQCDLAIWDIERPAELVYHLGRNPLHARVWRGR